MIDRPNDDIADPKSAMDTATPFEVHSFQNWIVQHRRCREAELELARARSGEREAWRKYVRSARRSTSRTVTDRFADEFRRRWYDR